MIKNKVAQIMFYTVYVVLGIIGLVNSMGYLDAQFNIDFYVYYTNLSNYICLGLIFVMLVKAVRQANAKEDSLMDVAPKFNFMCLIMIMITFLVYNILLAKENTVLEYFTSQSNLIMHVILPIMFILNWVLFYEHGKIKWYYPLLSVIMPLVYVVFILIRAGILNGATWTVIYPYFFLNLDALGIGGFVAWILVLLVVFVVIGYVIYLLDNIKKFKKSKN